MMKDRLKIAVLDMYDNWANEGMRCIKQIITRFLEQDGIEGEYHLFNVRANAEVPGLEYDIYLSSGGPGSPLASGEGWEDKYFAFVDALFDHNQRSENKKYLFLICHSYQMVSRHLGLGSVEKRMSTSFGVMPMHRLEDGQDELFFQGLNDPFYAVDSRDYQLIKPNWARFEELGAKALCIEKERPHVPLERAIMAIRFSDEVFGTQFHPEADSSGMLRYYLMPEKRKLVIENFGEHKYYEMIDRLDDPDKIMLTESVIIPQFLQHAAEQLMGVMA
jgi:homoserine O-succinyltransferase/O-acetyltransferase